MNHTPILSKEEVLEGLENLRDWSLFNQKITKKFQFEDFFEELEFLNKLGLIFEKFNYYPQIHISNKKVEFEIRPSHIKNKISNKEILVAQNIENIYENGEIF